LSKEDTLYYVKAIDRSPTAAMIAVLACGENMVNLFTSP
jgi:hypothetical protein